MATQVQNRRGTTAEHATFTGAVGEVTVDTTKDTVVVHDGSTAGGAPLLREDQSNLPTSAPTTGVYNNSGALALSTNGTGRLFVDASGNVGVGTNSPGTRLDVAGSINASSNITSNTATIFAPGAAAVAVEGLRLEMQGNVAANRGYYISFFGPNGSGASRECARIRGLVYSGGNNGGFLAFDTVPIAGVATQRAFIGREGTVNLSADAGSTSVIASIGGGEVARIDSSGRLLVGTSTARTAAGVHGKIQVETDDYVGLSVIHNANDAGGGNIVLGKSRGSSPGGVTIPLNGDNLGTINFAGADGTDLGSVGATIGAQVDGTPGTDSMPGRLVFSTTADGASSPTEQVRITSDRYVRLASGTGGIQFGGDTAAANALDDYEEGTWTATLVSTDQPDITATGSYRKVGAIVYFTVPFVLGFSKTITPSRFDLPFTTGSRQVFSGSVMRSDTIDPKQTISAGTGTGTSGGTFGVYLRTNDGSALTLTLPGTYTTRLNISGVFNV